MANNDEQASWFMTLGYNLSLWFSKTSILLLYIHALVHDYTRKATYVALAIVTTYNLWGLGMYATMCVPLAKTWDPSIPGTCHPWKVWWALTYLHIITDFLIFLIPIPVVSRMTIPIHQKLGLLIVFATGFL
jgi:hypothetical protein